MKQRAIVAILAALARTWRMSVRGQIPDSGVVAFWHGEMLPVWALFARRDAVALVSASRDGQLLAALLARWGYCLVRGSSSRGGRQALAALVEHARQGHLILITPDGPRGPRGVAKLGAFRCAHQANVPLLWCRVRCRWAWRFRRSWDHFLLPLPFASIEIEFSQPITVPPTLNDDGIAQLGAQVQSQYAPAP